MTQPTASTSGGSPTGRATERAGLIGDIIGSRLSEDRSRLQDDLGTLLDDVSGATGTHLSMTLGDEFQGDFSSLEAAVRASLLLHLGAVGTFRMRIGIGWGELSVEAPRGGAFGQDGPMWWRARDAIERAEELSDVRRTIVNTATTWDDFINDYLLARDQLIVDLDASNGDIARALISGVTQREIAESVGLHESSVSRRIRNHRLAVVAEFDDVRIPEFGSGT